MAGTAEFPGLRALDGLTHDPCKAALFAEDSFFREGWSDICALQAEPVAAFTSPVALMLFKSEAIATGKVNPALNWLAAYGFAPVALEIVPFSGPAIHGLWRYQIRRNTIDKIRLYTRWIGQTPALVVALRHVDPSTEPAAQTVSRLKGPALLAHRSDNDLRTYLQSPNSILNFIHTADEPADVVRELAVLVPAPRRRAFITAIGEGFLSKGVVRACISSIEPTEPHHADPRLAGKTIIDKLKKIDGPRAASAIARIERVLAGETVLDLYALEKACEAIVDDINPLDMFIFGSEFIERDIVGLSAELENHAKGA